MICASSKFVDLHTVTSNQLRSCKRNIDSINIPIWRQSTTDIPGGRLGTSIGVCIPEHANRLEDPDAHDSPGVPFAWTCKLSNWWIIPIVAWRLSEPVPKKPVACSCDSSRDDEQKLNVVLLSSGISFQNSKVQKNDFFVSCCIKSDIVERLRRTINYLYFRCQGD